MQKIRNGGVPLLIEDYSRSRRQRSRKIRQLPQSDGESGGNSVVPHFIPEISRLSRALEVAASVSDEVREDPDAALAAHSALTEGRVRSHLDQVV